MTVAVILFFYIFAAPIPKEMLLKLKDGKMMTLQGIHGAQDAPTRQLTVMDLNSGARLSVIQLDEVEGFLGSYVFPRDNYLKEYNASSSEAGEPYSYVIAVLKDGRRVAPVVLGSIGSETPSTRMGGWCIDNRDQDLFGEPSLEFYELDQIAGFLGEYIFLDANSWTDYIRS
jgi:hypothetical protein